MRYSFCMNENVKSRVDYTAPKEARIMVVDDEKGIRELFMKVISLHLPESSIDLAVNGAEAVERFQESKHNVIIMDLMMPVMDGEKAFFAIKRICDEKKWNMPAVIFCTGYAPSDMLDRIVAEDKRHCVVTKPISTDKLFALIRERLSA